MYLSTDPQLKFNLTGQRKNPFSAVHHGSPMSVQSSNFSSNMVTFDHKSMLCLSPPGNVNGAPLPTSNKVARNSKASQGKDGSTASKKHPTQVHKIPNINLRNLHNKGQSNSSQISSTEKSNSSPIGNVNPY
jgi:hypothetical protein